MTTPALPCFVCRVDLENLVANGNQPMRGTEFLTYGHYGSTVFDPMDGSRMALNICDACLRDRLALTMTYASLDRGLSRDPVSDPRQVRDDVVHGERPADSAPDTSEEPT